jgi:rhamnose utilization protein RhaD (predicted bifunctional aldolase and dehydrogenase)/NAD(P)-dependent dehydrogenase (short-subunit alcohol dehydrogenase family)
VAPTADDPLAQCVYGSRLLGTEPTLVLYGGGNTSVKAVIDDVAGGTVEVLYVKGSGWDLATISRQGFTALRMSRLRDLLRVERLSDTQMMNELRCARIDAASPDPSVESLLHALLPYPAVQHSHADALIALTNQPDGAALARQVFGDTVIIVPYVMPGFDLARRCAASVPAELGAAVQGIVLLNHGLFTFGASTEEAYRRHIELVARAERFLADGVPARPATQGTTTQGTTTQGTTTQGTTGEATRPAFAAVDLARLRRDISEVAGAPMVVTRHDDTRVREFVSRPDFSSLAGRGPLTPDHVIRTKRVPLVGHDVASYARDYEAYFDEHRGRRGVPLTMLDPAPRVLLDPRFGMLTVGPRAADADIAADIYMHTMDVISSAQRVGHYQALAPGDIFDVEYWELEQAKLGRAGARPPFAGEVAVVTGAASGIGRACAMALRSRGAAVIGLDANPAVAGIVDAPDFLGVCVDVTDHAGVDGALQRGVERFGGLDILVAAAGIFPAARYLAELDMSDWRATMAVNVDAIAYLLSRAHPLLALAPRGGRVVVVASKNVPAPGPGAAAYSASKAALTQLARVAALEWGSDRIRVNAVHPDAVFDTGLWTQDLLRDRAAKYGLTVDEYKHRNVLGVEITSALVGDLVSTLCADVFKATTGAQIPIDGGNDRVV